ncbi:hypothetical protein DV738_g91, partial [Chaetothyriales sp. CBS 135597]
MDSRFKTWFWSSRRVKPEPSYDLTLRGVSYDSVAPGATPPVFSHPIPPRHGRSSQPGSPPTVNASALCYDEAASQAPELDSRRIKGNDTVKALNHHSGEWTPVSPDADTSWEVIRESEYAVSKGGSRFSQSTPTLLLRSASPKRWSSISASKPPATAALPMRTPSASPLLGIPEQDDVGSLSTESPRMPCCKHPSIQSKYSIPGLGINETPSAPIGILKNSSKISLVEPRDEQNPVMRALWKAESTRLHSICSQGAFVDNYLSEPRRSSGKVNMDSPILEPVHISRNECRDASISFTLSRADTSHLDDVSDISSSGRLSHSSSAAISSHTSSTSTIESDSFTSRADIHKMVEEMRATYLQALETRETPLYPGTKSAKKSKKKRKSSTPSTRTTSESKSDMSRLSTDHTSHPRSPRSAKMVFQHLDDIANLPDRDGSHRQGRILDLDLAPADTGIIPGHRPESSRSSMKMSKPQRASRQRSKHYNNLSPRNASLVAAPDYNDDDDDIDPDKEFAEIYRLSLNEFWQSSPNLSSTTTCTSTFI